MIRICSLSSIRQGRSSAAIHLAEVAWWRVSSAFCLLCLLLLGSYSASGAENSVSVSQPERYALLIGINSYSSSKLSGCENDSRAMKKIIVENFGFPNDAVHIKELYNQDATKKAILAAIRTQLIDNAKRLKKDGKEGIFVFQFSGHGSQVPDVSGDEADGRDETICPVDVVLNDPKNDILDDEIESLIGEITNYTENLTLITDCCHSGSNNRATEFVPRRLERPALFARAYKRRGEQAPTDKQALTSEQAPADKLLLPPNKRYVAIAGCMADELSLETNTEGTDHGLMTSALVDALSTGNPKMTYKELWSKVTAKVNKSASSQHPVFEGDLDRIIFSGAASRGMPTFKVTNDDKDNEVQINAGTASGIEKGSLVAFYRKGVRQLTGDEGKITLGTVTEAKAFSATVKLSQIPGNDVVIADAQVVPVTPLFRKQEALKSFSNSSSHLNNYVVVKMQRLVSETAIAGTTKFNCEYREIDADSLTIPVFKSGEKFRLAITNKSQVDLYVAGLCAATSGSIDLVFPPQGANEKLEKGRTYFTPAFAVEGVSGIETLLIVFTTSPVDYAPLRQAAAAATTGRESTPDALQSLDDWCTKRLDYKVISTP